MTLVTWIATYIIIWWILFFMVLPWGNRAPDVSPVGFDRGAPETPRLPLKIGLTCLLALGLCALIHLALLKAWVDPKSYFLAIIAV